MVFLRTLLRLFSYDRERLQSSRILTQESGRPWQFIPETGRRYGLVVNHWVDERRTYEIDSSARYSRSYSINSGAGTRGAGYNAGENRIDKVIKRYSTKDFWKLRAYTALPRETREYVLNSLLPQ